MPILKKRPTLSLRCPKEIRTGARTDIQVLVKADKEVPIEAITVRIQGKHNISAGGYAYSETIVTLEGLAFGKTILEEGEHTFPFAFEIPQGHPGSYRGDQVATVYEVRARVDIDWWPDAVTDWVIEVVDSRRVKPVKGRAQLYKGHAGSPHLEMSLLSDTVEPGGVLEVQFACHEFHPDPGRSVEFALLTREARRGTYSDQRWLYQFPATMANRPVSLTIPPKVQRAVATTFYSVAHVLQLEVHPTRGRPVFIAAPITIAPVVLNQQGDLPQVGDSRMRSLFAQVAQRVGLEAVDVRLQNDDASVEVWMDGGLLRGKVEYPSFAIGLHCEQRKGFGKRLRRGLAVGSEAFQRNYIVKGREAQQVAFVIEQLEGSASNVLVDWSSAEDVLITDRFIEVSLQTEMNDRDQLTRLCHQLAKVHEVMKKKSAEVPLPGWAKGTSDEWNAAASSEGGSFRRGDLSLHFEYGDVTASVQTIWDDNIKPKETQCVVESAREIDSEYLGTRDDFSNEMHVLADAITTNAHNFAVQKFKLISLMSFHRDPNPALQQLMRMVKLRKLMAGDYGPYR